MGLVTRLASAEVLLGHSPAAWPQASKPALTTTATMHLCVACPFATCRPGPQPLASRGEPSLAGISSFAFMGTNAHVVLATAQAQASRPASGADEVIGGGRGEGLQLRHSSYWVAPAAQLLLQRAAPSAGGLGAGGRGRRAAPSVICQ